MEEIRKVLITDGRTRQSLQLIRSFSRMGLEVVLGESSFCGNSISNCLNKFVKYPDYKTDTLAFVKFCTKLCSEEDIDLIIPVRSQTIEIFITHRSLFGSCLVFIPSKPHFDICINKNQTVSFSKKLGIRTPRSIYLDKNSDFSFAEISDKLGNPIIAKPDVGSGSRGIFLLKSSEDYHIFKTNIEFEINPYLLQEYIPHGELVGVYGLYKNGNNISLNSHLRIREFPHSGGPSTLRKTIRNDYCERVSKILFRKLNYSGVAMVEFLFHKSERVPYLIEVNPRFWGSLALDIHSGVDFPKLIIDSYYGDSTSRSQKRKVGTICRWLLLGDVLWLLKHPKKIDALIQFINFRDQKFDVLSQSDPMPAFGAICEGFAKLFSSEHRNYVFKRGW